MHMSVIICIILSIILLFFVIYYMIKKQSETSLFIFIIGNVLIVGAIGFGLICGNISWQTSYLKISPNKVENYIFKDNGIVAIAYQNKLYHFFDIKYLNAVNNIDYYKLVIQYNAYGYELNRKLYPVEKEK